jgi:two-component system chemotaxis response regulator CheY
MSKTVMIVDDSSSFRTVVKLALQKAGYAVVEACDGLDALSKVDAQRVNLIVCDLNMPNMDGITVVKQIKSLPAHKFLPMILLATDSNETQEAQGKAAGARAWITKPVDPSRLVDAVIRLCV